MSGRGSGGFRGAKGGPGRAPGVNTQQRDRNWRTSRRGSEGGAGEIRGEGRDLVLAGRGRGRGGGKGGWRRTVGGGGNQELREPGLRTPAGRTRRAGFGWELKGNPENPPDAWRARARRADQHRGQRSGGRPRSAPPLCPPTGVGIRAVPNWPGEMLGRANQGLGNLFCAYWQ